MHIIRDKAKGVITLTPDNSDETAFIKSLAKKKKGFLLEYAGRAGADVNDPYRKRMRLGILSSGKRFELKASTDKNEKAVRLIRDALFFGGGGLILLSHSQVRSKPSINVCIAFCKHCKSPIIERGRCEWQICTSCVAKCGHEYQKGTLHGGTAQVLAVGHYCTKCGSGKSKEKVKVIIRHGGPSLLVTV